jgi:enolase
MGKGVLQAVENVIEVIADELLETDVFDQVFIDQMMIDLDGTENKFSNWAPTPFWAFPSR